jgi:polyisoprenoid-binding protein YceI
MSRAALLCVLLLTVAANAAPRSLPLDPEHAEVAFRAYALGVMPIDGRFTRFRGELIVDPAEPGRCRVALTVEVASLQMQDEAMRDDTLSSNLLDAAAFPSFAYSGECSANGIAGSLTLHGVTHRLSLRVTHERESFIAQAMLRRADWGITGRPLLAGATVRIRVSTVISP